MDPPSGRVPEQGLDWFSVAIEACGGGTTNLGLFLGVYIFIGILGIENKSGESTRGPQGRGACPHPCGGLGTPWCISGTPWVSSGPKIISVNFQVNWTPFDILFLRYSKTRKK